MYGFILLLLDELRLFNRYGGNGGGLQMMAEGCRRLVGGHGGTIPAAAGEMAADRLRHGRFARGLVLCVVP
jgi:hypothetical protein